MSAHEDKGKRYVELLDAARVNGSWNDIPELVRKVSKHAPRQTILTQTATAEHYVATRVSQRPATASKTSSTCIETLRQTLKNVESTLAEDVFQGETCLVWAASTGADQTPSQSVNTADVVPLFDRHGRKATSSWTKICLLRTVLIYGKNHLKHNEHQQALVVFRSATAWIELNIDIVRPVPQLAYWAEQLLAEYGTSKSTAIPTEARLKALQAWSVLATKTQEAVPSTYGDTKPQHSRASVWSFYYHLASQNLQNPEPLTSQSRSQQASQLRAIQSAYETSFLQNRKFPKATESNTPVEEWVEKVIQNWQILCGPGWQETDLGPGGRNAVTRNVLDVLYRAAVKTFHSTLILRRLFQVHKSLTEFDLAYKCLDTYIELVDRARERAAKAGESNPESDEVMLLTVSEGVEGLCAYGRQEEARRAFELAIKLEDWLELIVPDGMPTIPNGHVEHAQPSTISPTEPPSEEALQIVFRAIGVAKAHWARWTPFSETRSELQAEALVALNKAGTVSQPQLPTLYALAKLCADTREITQALKWTKIGLQIITKQGALWSTRDQCAFWHLMTLLLSSQQDFETAIRSSAATLDMILASGLLSVRDGSSEKVGGPASISAVDDLECDDLQRVIELQITYVALIELADGPEAALNHSGELLSLYSKLFKRFEVGDTKPPTETSLFPPKSSAGTVKSTKGSIFSRKKQIPSIAPSPTTTSLRSTIDAEKDVRPGTQASQAPTIQVTDETGKAPSRKHHHLLHRHHDHDDSGTKKLAKGVRPTTAKSDKPVPNLSETHETSQKATSLKEIASPVPAQHDSKPEVKQPLGEVPHNLASHEKMPPPTGHSEQPPEQDVRLPNVRSSSTTTSPTPRFPKIAGQKHALLVLNKTWLTVATLYRRSHMFEDATEACDEAARAASRIEALVSAIDPSARALADPGWGGGGKSSDEVWADVCCAKAELSYAVACRREQEGTPITSENLREVVEQYEHCLMYFPNHAAGIIGLSNILLDYYEKKIDLAKKVDDGRSFGPRPAAKHLKEDDILGPTTPSQEHLQDPFASSMLSGEDLRKTPENLNRIAARDRAYGLLNTLTKLGTGWDSSEAWYVLARAHELGGEIDRSKKILWWCIELEDTRPIRHWRNLGCGGYVL